MGRFAKKEIIIIVLFFLVYMIGYAWLTAPKDTQSRNKENRKVIEHSVSVPEMHSPKIVKSIQDDRPLDLGKYFYTIDIAPGYEMEEEEYELVGESGGNLIVRKHHDWPDISGHFEWYCNERLTSTQQMYDYVVAHRNAIIRQMQEVRRRGIDRIADEASYFQDHYDEYLDDPEDEIRFPPEIFDANED